MSWILSVDSGIEKCGCALWRDGELCAARLVLSKDWIGIPDPNLGVRVRAMCAAIDDWVGCAAVFTHVVVEVPQTYGGRAAKGDANDLIKVAAVAGALAGTLVYPTEWKGSIPKPETKSEYEEDGYVIENRAREELAPEELARIKVPSAWKPKLDVWDAIGIGLWYLKKEKQR